MTHTLDTTFDALANEHRRDLVQRLRSGPLETPALAQHYSMSRQALHRHVRILEGAGLVRSRRLGRTRCLELAAEPLDEVTAWVGEVRAGWQASADRLGRHLAATAATEATDEDGATS